MSRLIGSMLRTAENLKHAVKGMLLLRQRGIWANVGVIAGLPGDSLEGFRDTLRFVSEQALGRLFIYPLQVFPGSAFHRQARELGLQFDPAPSHQVTCTPLISKAEMRAMINAIPDLVEEMNQPYLRELSRGVLKGLRERQAASPANLSTSGGTCREEAG